MFFEYPTAVSGFEAFPSGSYGGGTWEEAKERGNINQAQNRKKMSKSNFKKYIKWRVNLWEIKSWCVKVLGSQQKVKKVLVLHYSIDYRCFSVDYLFPIRYYCIISLNLFIHFFKLCGLNKHSFTQLMHNPVIITFFLGKI